MCLFLKMIYIFLITDPVKLIKIKTSYRIKVYPEFRIRRFHDRCSAGRRILISQEQMTLLLFCNRVEDSVLFVPVFLIFIECLVDQAFWIYRGGFLHWSLTALSFVTGSCHTCEKVDSKFVIGYKSLEIYDLSIPQRKQSPISITFGFGLCQPVGSSNGNDSRPSIFKCSIKHKK